jgi:hypothetical protein
MQRTEPELERSATEQLAVTHAPSYCAGVLVNAGELFGRLI